MKTTSLLRFTLAAAVALGISAPASAQTQKQAPPAGSPPKPFVVPKKQTFTLPNGIQVTMVPYGATPKVTVNAFVRAGNIN